MNDYREAILSLSLSLSILSLFSILIDHNFWLFILAQLNFYPLLLLCKIYDIIWRFITVDYYVTDDLKF